MAYNELVKNFNRIRDYMREFYVYGFKSRKEYDNKSARSYDNEKRRIESWLGEYMSFNKTKEGKNVFISIDSRLEQHNPLYKAWKAKSFTNGDITLHFILFDILYSKDISMSIKEIMKEIDNILINFDNPKFFDESTVRKKLNEYVSQGIIVKEKKGSALYYSRSKNTEFMNIDCLDYYSEIAPCGVIGSYLLDKVPKHKSKFNFKHHYITNTMDSEVIEEIFNAIREEREIKIRTINQRKKVKKENEVVPLKIYISVQNGREYLMSYSLKDKVIFPCRIDNIVSVKLGNKNKLFKELRKELEKNKKYIWGVSTGNKDSNTLEHVEFTIKYNDDEFFIPKRLEREKRCGKIEEIGDNKLKFSADVYDSMELVPWIRTFICRIEYISFSNKKIEKQFKEDIEKMYQMYEIEVKNDF